MKEKKPYVAPKMQTYNIQVRQFLCTSSTESIIDVEEGYGIIYNQSIMDKYFALDGAKVKENQTIVK